MSINNNYRIYKTDIKVNNVLYPLLDEWSHLANNMYNDALFLIRQLFTGLSKDENDMFDLELSTIDSVNKILEDYPKELVLNKDQRLVNYHFLDYYFKKTNNKNYNSLLPKQTAQAVIKDASKSFEARFKALRSYKLRPNLFTGKPKMPKYKKSGASSSFVITNQDVKFYKNKFNSYKIKFPKTKNRLNFKNILDQNKRFKQAIVVKFYDSYRIIYTFEEESLFVPKTSSVYCGIDLGVDNVASIVTSNGDSLLVKGKLLKSKNRLFNKKISKNLSGQTIGTNNKAKSSKALCRLYKKRANYIEDQLHKIAKKIIDRCVKKDVSTIVIGNNPKWKQNINIGKTNNQNFLQIPHYKLIQYIKDLSNRLGIECITQEESYTSKASFLDNDDIPVYDKGINENYIFSGKRITRAFYKSKDNIIIHADLNAALNIMRKHNKDLDIQIDINRLQSPEIFGAKEIYR